MVSRVKGSGFAEQRVKGFRRFCNARGSGCACAEDVQHSQTTRTLSKIQESARNGPKNVLEIVLSRFVVLVNSVCVSLGKRGLDESIIKQRVTKRKKKEKEKKKKKQKR